MSVHPLWVFVACSRVNLTFTFTEDGISQGLRIVLAIGPSQLGLNDSLIPRMLIDPVLTVFFILHYIK